jgi:hypothetical protein
MSLAALQALGVNLIETAWYAELAALVGRFGAA